MDIKISRAAVVHLNFRAGSTPFWSQFVLYLALWTGLAGATRLTLSDIMLHIGSWESQIGYVTIFTVFCVIEINKGLRVFKASVI